MPSLGYDGETASTSLDEVADALLAAKRAAAHVEDKTLMLLIDLALAQIIKISLGQNLDGTGS